MLLCVWVLCLCLYVSFHSQKCLEFARETVSRPSFHGFMDHDQQIHLSRFTTIIQFTISLPTSPFSWFLDWDSGFGQIFRISGSGFGQKSLQGSGFQKDRTIFKTNCSVSGLGMGEGDERYLVISYFIWFSLNHYLTFKVIGHNSNDHWRHIIIWRCC